MLVSSIKYELEPVIRHERERASGELDTVDEFAPVGKQLVEVRLGHRCIVWPSNLSDTLCPIGLYFKVV